MSEVTKRNFQKILREIDISKYPSLLHNPYLSSLRTKLINKEKLSYVETQLGFHKLKAYFDELIKEELAYISNNIDFSKFSHRPLDPYQEEGVKFLLANNGAILADDTGLGKSIVSVCSAMTLPEEYKILVITLKTLKYNFQSEIKPYCESYKVVEKKWETGYKFTLVHYDALKKYKADIIKENYDCVIIDEAHTISNAKIGRSKHVAEIIKQTTRLKKLWLLTGTPMTNRPSNYFNLLKLIGSQVAKNWYHYVTRYCNGGHDEWGIWQTNGSSNLEELHRNTKDVVLRRLKKDCLPDLPSKTRSRILLNLENRKRYDKVIDDFKNKKLLEFLDEREYGLTEEDINVRPMTKLILWRIFCENERIRDGSLFETVDNELAQGNKVVVFTNFTSVVDAVAANYDKNCKWIDGRINDAEKRLQIVDEFNSNPDLHVLVLNLKVGGTGLNIQSANVVVFNGMSWVPGDMMQGEDRVWRRGQKKPVKALYLVYENTVEDIVYSLVESKMRNISTAVEGKEEGYFEEKRSDVSVQNEKDSILAEIFAQLK